MWEASERKDTLQVVYRFYVHFQSAEEVWRQNDESEASIKDENQNIVVHQPTARETNRLLIGQRIRRKIKVIYMKMHKRVDYGSCSECVRFLVGVFMRRFNHIKDIFTFKLANSC